MAMVLSRYPVQSATLPILRNIGSSCGAGWNMGTNCHFVNEVISKMARPKAHGMHNTPTYRTWDAMKRRCQNPKRPNFRYYGGRGITVCHRWQKFDNFFADMGTKPAGMTLDRIDTNREYGPENCRWASAKTQANNRNYCRFLNHNGKTQTIAQWADELGITHSLIHNRLQDGWPIDRALMPVKFSRWGPRIQVQNG
jgi:hypothetical protein